MVLLGILAQSSANLDANLETSSGTAAGKSLTTSHSEQANPPPVLLKAVKKEVSDDSVDTESFQNNTTAVSKDYTKRNAYGNSAKYAHSTNNMEMNDKNSEILDNKDVKSRNCRRISSGIMINMLMEY